MVEGRVGLLFAVKNAQVAVQALGFSESSSSDK